MKFFCGISWLRSFFFIGTLLTVILHTCTTIGFVFAEKKKGSTTGLPIPRYVSTKNKKVFVRRGPSQDYRIDWIYQLSGYPLKVIAESNHWRQVEDFQGEGGWIHFRLISGKRSVVITKNATLLRRKARLDSRPLAVVNSDVVASLISVNLDWCYISLKGQKGWIQKTALWGVSEGESFGN